MKFCLTMCHNNLCTILSLWHICYIFMRAEIFNFPLHTSLCNWRICLMIHIFGDFILCLIHIYICFNMYVNMLQLNLYFTIFLCGDLFIFLKWHKAITLISTTILTVGKYKESFSNLLQREINSFMRFLHAF